MPLNRILLGNAEPQRHGTSLESYPSNGFAARYLYKKIKTEAPEFPIYAHRSLRQYRFTAYCLAIGAIKVALPTKAIV